jgi:aminopeptidase C
MKRKYSLIATLIACFFFTQAQDTPSFTVVKELPVTPVKNQSRSGTCWAFSGAGMLEAELLRTGKGEYDLSEMFIVNKCYLAKAEKYVRLHGFLNYAQGGSFHDVLYVLKNYGAVPEEIYHGIEYGDSMHNHSELESLSAALLKAVIAKPQGGKLSPVWQKAHQAVIETYLGVAPDTFNFKGKEYTPLSFAKSLGLDADDYVSLTSYTHHPFYSTFSLEIQDNWLWGVSYNLPLNELMEVFDYAIDKGYPIAWGADVSERGFNRDGVASLENLNYEDITQELRQKAYDNYETTDDHGMLIYGLAKDANGNKYYMVKNSWGTSGKYKGMLYASQAYTAYKTMNIVVHKDGIPKALRKKLNIK